MNFKHPKLNLLGPCMRHECIHECKHVYFNEESV